MATASLLRISLSSQPNFTSNTKRKTSHLDKQLFSNPLLQPINTTRSSTNSITTLVIRSKAVQIGSQTETQQQSQPQSSSLLLDVTGMMCGSCVSRVKSILSADDRVESVVVNMLTETAAIKLKSEVTTDVVSVGEELGLRLTECGFPSKRRKSGLGIGENVKKWKEMNRKKEEMIVKSRNRVLFAWTLVALCCGSHASHILHSVGIHIGHGSFLDILHNSYVKGGLALGALLGPGRGVVVEP